jgi:hypothetical protein
MMTTKGFGGIGGTDAIDERTLSADGVVTRMWFALVSASRPYDQLFEPATWARCGKLSTYDIVRCRAVDRSCAVSASAF